MKTRALPGTALELTVVGLGCWALGDPCWGPVDDATAIAAIRTAVECGINWFDTAPIYGDGHSDALLKRALGSHLGAVLLATKVGVRTDGRVRSDLQPAHILSDCEASLRRLREPLDLIQVHWPCEGGTPLEDTLGALDDLKQRGWIRHYGLCNYGAAQLREARAKGTVVSLQTPYSAIRRDFEGDLRGAAEGVGVLAYEGLGRGLLTGKYAQEPQFDEHDIRARDPRFQGRAFRSAVGVARDFAAIGERVGLSAAAIALGWVASRPGVTAVIAGARTPEQVRANAQAARVVDHVGLRRVFDQL